MLARMLDDPFSNPWLPMALALVFALAGFVKGMVGLGLPTIAMALLSLRLATACDRESGVSRAALVYAADRDGDLATDSDQELFAVQGDDDAGAWDWKTPRQSQRVYLPFLRR